MPLDNILAQPHAIKILTNTLSTQKYAQAYIFAGPDGTGKLLTALTFAKALNCHHPDVDVRPCNTCSSCKKIDLFLHPDIKYLFPIPNFDLTDSGDVKKEKEAEQVNAYIEAKKRTPYLDYHFDAVTAIRIEQIRGLLNTIIMGCHEARTKVIIIEGFEKITTQAANAFLKTLEEPPPDTVFIFTCENAQKLLPTIRSRCNTIAFNEIPPDIIESYLTQNLACDSVRARLYSRLANGSLARALCLYHENNLSVMDMTIDFLKTVTDKDDIAFMSWIETYFSKTVKNTDIFSDFIQYLSLWLTDIVLYRINPSEIVFANHIELIERFLSVYPSCPENARQISITLNGFFEKSLGNVNIKLILCQIYFLFTK